MSVENAVSPPSVGTTPIVSPPSTVNKIEPATGEPKTKKSKGEAKPRVKKDPATPKEKKEPNEKASAKAKTDSAREKKDLNEKKPKVEKNASSTSKESIVLTPYQKKRLVQLKEQEKEFMLKEKEAKAKYDTHEKKINRVKWPIKDELVVDKLLQQIKLEKGPKSEKKNINDLQKPIPPPEVELNLKDKNLASDVVACWDFMNLFSGLLELQWMSLEDFIDLLEYRGQDSIPFVELFTAPLRCIIGDENLCAKLSLDIPLETNFARKLTAVELQVGRLGTLKGGNGLARPDSLKSLADANTGNDVGMSIEEVIETNRENEQPAMGLSSLTQALVAEHRRYSKPISLLPRRLRHDLVDPLRWQAVCTAILPHLPPVRAFLKLSLELENLTTDFESLQTMRAWTNESGVGGRELSNTSIRQREKQEKSLKAKLMHAQETHKDSPAAIKQVSDLLLQSNATHKSKDIDIDSALCITSDVKENLSKLRDAMSALHSSDLHTAAVADKVFILKMLFKACYSTELFIDRIQSNADVLIRKNAERRANLNEKLREKRAGSKAVQDRAIAICREENKEKAEEKSKADAEKAAKLAEKKAKVDADKAAKVAEKQAGKAPSTGDKKDTTKKGVKRTVDGEEKSAASSSTDADKQNESEKEPPSKKKGKGNKKDSDPFAPSYNQLAAKIEELLFYDEIGIDAVHDLGDDVVSDDEEDAELVEIDGVLTNMKTGEPVEGGRKRGAASRQHAAEREQKRLEVVRRNEARSNANIALEEAIESGREQDLKRAIKIGKRDDLLRWEEDNNEVYCTPLMLKAEKLYAEIEDRIKSEKDELKFIRTMKEYTVRTEPLGSDRHGNTYWAFTGDEDRLYVCLNGTTATSPDMDVVTSGSNGNSSPSKAVVSPISSTIPTSMHINVPSGSEVILFDKDPSLKKLFDTRPYTHQSEAQQTWKIYGAERSIYYLWEALDDRGIKERSLREKIRSAFDYEFNPPVEYTQDHEWVGRSIERVFNKRSKAVGVVDGWLRENLEDDDEALWHVVYKDGDHEELDEQEMKRFLLPPSADFVPYGTARVVKEVNNEVQEQPVLSSALVSTDMLADMDVERRTSSRAALLAEQQAAEEKAKVEVVADGMETESDDEEETPDIVLRYDNKDREGNWRRYLHRPTRAGYYGFNGLKAEMGHVLTIIEEGLKRASMDEDWSFSKEDKKLLRTQYQTAHTVSDLRNVLLSFEEIIHKLASDVSDLDDADVAKSEQDKEHEEMKLQGWNFDTNCHKYVGKKARRFFLRTGASDGVITAMHTFTDPKTNVTHTKFWMEHADGDAEEITDDRVFEHVKYAINAYELNQMTDVSAATRHEANDDDDDLDDGDDDDYENRDIDDMIAELQEQEEKLWTIEAEEDPDVDPIERLWPTIGVRKRWLSAVRTANCVADLAMGQSALLAQAVSFGVADLESSPFALTKDKSPHEVFKKTTNVSTQNGRSRKGSDPKGRNKKGVSGVSHDGRSRRGSRAVNYSE
jgi:hypothetical protein